MRAFFQSLALQGRVISALMYRELNTRYGRENIGFLWVIGEPILFCGGVSILWTAIRPPYDNGIPMTAFVITGYVPLTMWRHCVSRSINAFNANGALLFHKQVTPTDILLTRVILEVVGTLAAGLLVAAAAIWFGYMKAPADIGLLYVGLAYQVAFSLASAFIIASLSEMSEFVEKCISVVMYLSIPLSGAFTMVAWLPKSFQTVVLYSPSVQSVEMIRAGTFGPSIETHYNFGYTTYCIAIMLLIGMLLTTRVRKYILVH